MTLEIPETPGKCRWCGCTWERPCENTCGWANRQQTLCIECVDVDRLMRSARGRAQLVARVNDAEDQAEISARVTKSLAARLLRTDPRRKVARA